MHIAIVLVNAKPGTEDTLARKLRKIQHVKEARVVYGIYDIIVRIEAETMQKVREIIAWRIRTLDEVRNTVTMLVLSP